MSSPRPMIETKLAVLRRSFDEAFASPPSAQAEAPEALLAITVAGERLAIRLRDISALAAVRGKIVPVPSRMPALAGVTALRGAVVPVFRLSGLLGIGETGEQVRWMVLAGEGAKALALGFHRFEGYVQINPEAIFAGNDEAERQYVRETAHHNGLSRGIINVALLADGIRKQRLTTRQT